MKTHETLAALAKAGVSPEDVSVLEGYLEVQGNSVRVHTRLNGGTTYEVDSGEVIHEEQSGEDGKIKLYLAPKSSVVLRMQAAGEADGTWCSPGGTMYCWIRRRTPSGGYVIVLEPCGSCIPDSQASAAIATQAVMRLT